ncbi:MAG: ribose 5-phosphate isomerase B [Firmicutes bacterium]|nr:ribose 5-phosphate isomerase B [Bacillota bacterium]
MKVVLAADHAGYALKENIKDLLAEKKIVYEDMGTYDREKSVDYPDLAFQAACAVQRGDFTRGILVCGTGLGMAIVANKLHRIRAAPCNDLYSARYARAHNDVNILTLGARILQTGQAHEIVTIFLETPFEGGRHLLRVEKIKELEKQAQA